MKILKWMLVGFIILCFIGLIFITYKFFSKFNDRFSENPEDWYSSGALIISFLTLLITSIIAIYINEITKQSTKFPEQRKIYNALMQIKQDFRDTIYTNFTYIEYQIRIDSLIRYLNILKGESFIFNDSDLYEEAVTKYRDKLSEISQKVTKVFNDNLSNFSNDSYARLGQIKLMDISDKVFEEIVINDEERYLKKSVIKAMK